MDTLSATESYLSMLLSLPGLQPMTVLALFFLTLARILPIIAVAPFLGAKNLPMTVRMLFSLSLVAIFLPQNLMSATHDLFFTPTYIGLFCKELLIGFILGFIASAPFFIAQIAGSLIDQQRGASSLQVTDPTTQATTGPVGILYSYVLYALFFILDGPFLFFDGVAKSYLLFPADQWLNTAFFAATTPMKTQLDGMLNVMMTLAIQLSAPALIGILLTDLFLGIANRLAPQVQIVFLGISLKSWVGIALMTAAWGLIIQVLGKESIAWIKALNHLINQMGLVNK